MAGVERRGPEQFTTDCPGANNNLENPAQVVIPFGKRFERIEVKCEYLNRDDNCSASQLASVARLPGSLPRCVVVDFLGPRAERAKERITCMVPGVGELIYDRRDRRVLESPLLEEGHEPVKLTRSTGIILEVLMDNQGAFFTGDELAEAYGASTERTGSPQVLLHRLRQALGESQNRDRKKIIVSEIGMGYRIPKAEEN